jgi:hypothetical protein
MIRWTNYYKDIYAYKSLASIQDYAFNRLHKYLKEHTKIGFGYNEFDYGTIEENRFEPIRKRHNIALDAGICKMYD